LNYNWQEKLKYSKKTRPNAAVEYKKRRYVTESNTKFSAVAVPGETLAALAGLKCNYEIVTHLIYSFVNFISFDAFAYIIQQMG
jgi:hypothetical protein